MYERSLRQGAEGLSESIALGAFPGQLVAHSFRVAQLLFGLLLSPPGLFQHPAPVLVLVEQLLAVLVTDQAAYRYRVELGFGLLELLLQVAQPPPLLELQQG